MSLPEFPQPPCLTQEQALNMILSSIAMEEAALSRVIEAEAQKIERISAGPGPCACYSAEAILAVNRSVTQLMEVIMQTQVILKGKMERVLEAMPPPPCMPSPPKCSGYSPAGTASPPDTPMPPVSEFEAIPSSHETEEVENLLYWAGRGSDGREGIQNMPAIRLCSIDNTRILLPPGGRWMLRFVAELSTDSASGESVKMQLHTFHDGFEAATCTFYPPSDGPQFFSGMTHIETPAENGDYFLTLSVESLASIRVLAAHILLIQSEE